MANARLGRGASMVCVRIRNTTAIFVPMQSIVRRVTARITSAVTQPVTVPANRAEMRRQISLTGFVGSFSRVPILGQNALIRVPQAVDKMVFVTVWERVMHIRTTRFAGSIIAPAPMLSVGVCVHRVPVPRAQSPIVEHTAA